MTNIPCLYAIIRFCPFVETEEFANVGIIALAPGNGFFDYKLVTRKHARITHFFEQLDGAVFRAAMHNLRDELVRVSTMLSENGFNQNPEEINAAFAKNLFQEIVRPRETVIKFSAVRAVLAASPKEKLNELYGYYVDRDFVTKEYREAALERTMRKWLHDAGASAKFDRAEVGNDEYYATFPFVRDDGELVVKPLNLAQDQSNKILDHGGQWLFRIQTLKRKNLLPQQVLFAVDGPRDNGPRDKAYEEIMDSLESAGATVLTYDNKAEIMEFIA